MSDKPVEPSSSDPPTDNAAAAKPAILKFKALAQAAAKQNASNVSPPTVQTPTDKPNTPTTGFPQTNGPTQPTINRIRTIAGAVAATRKNTSHHQDPILEVVETQKSHSLRKEVKKVTATRSDLIRERTPTGPLPNSLGSPPTSKLKSLEGYGLGSGTLPDEVAALAPRPLISAKHKSLGVVAKKIKKKIDKSPSPDSPNRDSAVVPIRDPATDPEMIHTSADGLKINTAPTVLDKGLAMMESPDSVDGAYSDDGQPVEHVDIMVSDNDLVDIHKVAHREMGPRKFAKLFFADDLAAWDEITEWKRLNSGQTIEAALAYFCPRKRSADVIVRMIYGDTDDCDYVMRYRKHHTDNENSLRVRELFEEKLLHHGLLLEIESSLDKDHVFFVKVFTPFHFLALESYKMGLQFNLREPLHRLDSDAHPPEVRQGLFGYFKTYHLDLNKHTAELDPLDLSSFEFKLPDTTSDAGYKVVNVVDQARTTANSSFVAFYFVYLEFYNRCLSYSSLCGLIVFLYGIYDYFSYTANHPSSSSHLFMRDATGHEEVIASNLTDITSGHSNETIITGHTVHDQSWHKLFDNALTPWFAFFMSLWSVCYAVAWARREKYYSFKWAMHNHDPPPLRRVEFVSVGVRKSPVTNKMELYFPVESRLIRQIISFIILLVFCAISCFSVLAQIFFILHFEEEGVEEQLVAFGGAMMGVLLIQICRRIFRPICHLLNTWENYRTEEEFEQALVLKHWSFEFINIYCHIVYFAFIRPHMKDVLIFGHIVHAAASCDPTKDVCSADVILELLVIFICDQIIERFEELGIPRIQSLFRAITSKKTVNISSANLHSKAEDGNNAIRPQYYRDEIRSEYEGLYEDYLPKAIQYGYVTMFVTAFPLAPLFALLNNAFETRMDLYKLLKVLRRAPPFLGSGIGVWDPILRGCSILAVSTNGLLVTFSSEYFFTTVIEPYDESQWMVVRLTFLILWHVVIYLLGIIILWIIPGEPEIIKIARDREEYLERIMLDPSAEAEDEEFGSKVAEAAMSHR
ncbi:UNVERIFIED_CONTAM: hypothetical protein HDU68_012549 [Siphonaria sp. JEL0065]|nr:hypothetical protein HDU68_012549 [Siphonaria sp. JEL0065]